MKLRITGALLLWSLSAIGQQAARVIQSQAHPQGKAKNVVYIDTSQGLNRILNAELDSISLDQSVIIGLSDSLGNRYTKPQSDGRYLQYYSEIDPVWNGDKFLYYTKSQSDSKYLQFYTENDPVWSAASSSYYTKGQADARYLQSYTESDPIWTAVSSNYYTKTQSDGRYLQSYTETDPLYTSGGVKLSGAYINPSWITSLAVGKITGLATVSTTGSYNDLANQPTIPTNTNQLTNGAGFLTGITSSQVNTALGYTAYNGTTNPNSYINASGARSAISLTTTGSGAATYNNSTGVLNVPTPATAKRQETYTGVTNASGAYTVTFGTAYATAPNVQASIPNQGVTEQFIRVTSVSTTGFTVNVFQRNVLTILTSIQVLAGTVTNVSGATVDVLVTEK